MAIIRSLAVGKARKSAGNLTYQTVKGRTIAREKPAFVANPNTPRQQEQRGKMRNLVAAWRAWFSLLKPYFTVIDGFGSAYNQFVKMNMLYAEDFSTDPNSGVVQFGSAYLANGKYPERSLSPKYTGGILSILVKDIQLQEDVEVGDRFISIRRDGPSVNPEIAEYTLTADDVSNIREGLSVDTGIEAFEESNLGILFYSSARRTSSTLFVAE